jgi:hypothetical protein
MKVQHYQEEARDSLMTNNHPSGKFSPNTGKKSRKTTKKTAGNGFFGQLPDWKIDTQAFKDEIRQTDDPGSGDYTKKRKQWLEQDPDKHLAAVIAHGKKKTRA